MKFRDPLLIFLTSLYIGTISSLIFSERYVKIEERCILTHLDDMGWAGTRFDMPNNESGVIIGYGLREIIKTFKAELGDTLILKTIYRRSLMEKIMGYEGTWTGDDEVTIQSSKKSF